MGGGDQRSAQAGAQVWHFVRLAFVACVALASPTIAQQVGECDWRASAQAIAEPWEKTTRTFANGRTRLAVLDLIEPAAGAFYLLVLSPPEDELGGRQCRVIGMGNGVGFAGLNFEALEAGYDPSVGLMFSLPVSIYGDGDFRPRQLNLSLNQATGHIGAELR